MKTTEKREKSTTSPKSSKVQGADKGISPAKTPKVKKVAPKKEDSGHSEQERSANLTCI